MPPERAILSTAARNAGGSATFCPACSRANLSTEFDRTFADFSGSDIDPRHPSRRRELDELGAGRRHLAAHVIFFLRHGDDGAAFRGLVGIAGEQSGFSRLTLGDARNHE